MTTGSQKPLVIQTEHLDPACAAWLAERCELVVCPSEDSRFPALLARADALVIRTYTNVSRDLLSKAPRLRVVGRAGVGLDNVDQDACRERGVIVCSTPGANTRAVVELVTAFMLDALRPRLFLDRALPQAEWNALRKELIAPRQLSDLTLGVLGLGRVGTGVARVGRALDVRVLYCDVLTVPDDHPARLAGATPVEFQTLMRESDILSIHPDGRASNRHVINAAAMAVWKPDIVFINTARGFLVDPHALADVMIRHPAALALLDVHVPEPFGNDYPLLDIDNVRLSPHIAAATGTAHRNMSWVVKDVWEALERSMRQ